MQTTGMFPPFLFFQLLFSLLTVLKNLKPVYIWFKEKKTFSNFILKNNSNTLCIDELCQIYRYCRTLKRFHTQTLSAFAPHSLRFGRKKNQSRTLRHKPQDVYEWAFRVCSRTTKSIIHKISNTRSQSHHWQILISLWSTSSLKLCSGLCLLTTIPCRAKCARFFQCVQKKIIYICF